MSNVIPLAARRPIHTKAARVAALAQTFASARRVEQDVFWLKENAELLSILECTGAEIGADELQAYAGFYSTAAQRMSFFPQYYRFLTSITLDLEDLGFAGNSGEALCAFVQSNALVAAELSDLQRGEAMRLLARRGFATEGETQLKERLHSFINHDPSFAVPNRKAAYELTHIVFYLSEYGRIDPELSPSALRALRFAGIIAHMEQNADLLAEVCVALRFAGAQPPAAWENWLASVQRAFEARSGDLGAGDDYHEFLVTNWAIACAGGESFRGTFSGDAEGYFSPVRPIGALRCLSEVLYDWDGARQSDWDRMQARVDAVLPDHVAAHMQAVIEATDDFAHFFEHFSRAAHPAGLHSEAGDVVMSRV